VPPENILWSGCRRVRGACSRILENHPQEKIAASISFAKEEKFLVIARFILR